MGERYGRWEADPLFAAAEVVQDSADRMESVYRLLLHEEKLIQSQKSSNSNLMSSVQYHRRDVATALETTRWQLEDFARAVDYVTISDNSNSRKNSISKFNQFVQAIRGQIVEIEKNLNKSYHEFASCESSKLLNSTDRETDELASFLSGTGVSVSAASHASHEAENGVMRMYDDHMMTNGHDEIVEITEELAPVTGVESNCTGALDLESANSGAKCYPYKNGVMRPHWNLLRKFWQSRSRESFTKRRKDGEILEKYHPQYNNQLRIPLAKIAFVSLVVLCLLVFLFHVA